MHMHAHANTRTTTHYPHKQLVLVGAKAVLLEAAGMDELVICKPELGDKPTAPFFMC